jgi:dTDP-4-dehydrorhamnose reductase
MKIAVVGSGGMLGHAVVNFLSKNKDFTIYAFTRNRKICREGNIFYIHYNELFSFFLPYDYLINCAGVLRAKEKTQESLSESLSINTILPLKILESELSNKIINITTDGVFSGKDGNYLESSCHNACDVYGKTKSLGEIKSDKVFNLRCSIIGKELNTSKNLLSWFLNQDSNAKIDGYTNHFWNGITTLQFAKICENIITNNVQSNNIQHIVPIDTVSKYELLKLFNKYFKKNINIFPKYCSETVNKTLSTVDPIMNSTLWGNKIKSIEEMISDIAEA